MRILADENFPRDAVNALRQLGHDVVWIRTDAPGSTDKIILQSAQVEQRIIITFDKDFGELAFRHKLPASSGVILFRLPGLSPTQIIKVVIDALTSRTDWSGIFAVITEQRIRIVNLP